MARRGGAGHGPPDEPEEDDWGADLPEEQEVPRRGRRGARDDDDDDEAFDDLPSTHLSDEDYEQFLASELDAEGRVKGDPPVTALLLGLVAVIVVGAVVWALVAG